ncbi:hypothetical protein ACFQ0O_38385 [Saccharopolyspora spinosporotrichia]
MGSTDFAVAPPPDRRPHRVRAAVRVFGEVLITLGLVLLLFVFYEVYVTDWFTARKQDDASRRLDQQWRAPGPPPPAPGRRRVRPAPHTGLRPRLPVHGPRGHRSGDARGGTRPLLGHRPPR